MFYIWSVFCLFVILVLLVRWLIHHCPTWFRGRVDPTALQHTQFLWVALFPATLGWWCWRGLPTVDTGVYFDIPWVYLWITSNFWSLLGWTLTVLVTHTCMFKPDGGRETSKWFGKVWLRNFGPLRFWGPANYPLYSWMAITVACAIMVVLQGIPDAGPNLIQLSQYPLIGSVAKWLVSVLMGDDVIILGLKRYPHHWGWVLATVISLMFTILSFTLTHLDEVRDAWRRAVENIRLRRVAQEERVAAEVRAAQAAAEERQPLTREQAAVEANTERVRRQRELEEAAADGQSVCLRCGVIEPERCSEGHCLGCTETCGSGHCQKCNSCNTCPRCGCGGGNECDRCRDFMDDDD